MFFRRKHRLRNEYDAQLIQHMESLKKNRINQKLLLERSVDPSDEAINTAKIAELKYFYLLKEAKKRKVILKR